MDITSNYFDIFGLPVSYHIDLNLLADRYRDMQRQFHPDKYAGKSAREHRLAEQYAATLNQAYSELKSPLRRAQYLLALRDVDASGEAAVTRDPQFLMEQMALREALAEVREASDPFAALAQVAGDAGDCLQMLQCEFAEQIASEEIGGAQETVAKMQFFNKLLDEVQALEHELDE